MKKIVLLILPLLALNACKIHEQMAKTDLIGFSTDIEPSYSVRQGTFKNWCPQGAPIDLTENEDQFISHLQELTSDDNTALYYATDVAIDRIRYVRKKVAKHDPQTLYYVFLISDGLDNASVKVAHNHHQASSVHSPEQYQQRIARRLRRAMGSDKNSFTVYPMVYKGKDLKQVQLNNKMSDQAFDQYLKDQFACFRFSTKDSVPEVNIHTSFKDIYKQLQDEFLHSEYTFRVAKDYAGKQIRMSVKNKKGEKAQIEGTLQRTGLSSYVLKDFRLSGVSADLNDARYISTNQLNLKSQNDAYRAENVFFVLPDLRLEKDQSLFVPVETIQEYKNGEVWQQNTEYTKEAASKPNTYCIFLLDTSKSMDTDIQEAKECIKKIVKMIN